MRLLLSKAGAARIDSVRNRWIIRDVLFTFFLWMHSRGCRLLQAFPVVLGRFESRIQPYRLAQFFSGLIFVSFFFQNEPQPPVRRRQAWFVSLRRLGQVSPQIFFRARKLLRLIADENASGCLIQRRQVIGYFVLQSVSSESRSFQRPCCASTVASTTYP